MDTLYFHDLPRAHEGTHLVSVPPELADELAKRWGCFQRDEPEPAPTVGVLAFLVRGPERVDRYGLMVRADLIHGTPESNADSIRRTTPDGWEVLIRTATL